MSDELTHECGIAAVRLKHPLEWYRERHGDALWGLRRLYLLMEKQHNRGQDGAGIASVRFDMPAGDEYLTRLRNAKRSPIERIFDEATEPARELGPHALATMPTLELKRAMPLLGEAMIGHLRYGTHGGRGQSICHPFIRRHSVSARTLALCGNFNMTNAPELFQSLVGYGVHPVGESDTGVVLEKIAHSIDREHNHLRATMGAGSLRNLEGAQLVEESARQVDWKRVLEWAAEHFDGGYVLAGLVGSGDLFVCRDPHGIRPAFILETDEVVAVASERPALAGVFGVDDSLVRPLPPGHALTVRRDGTVRCDRFAPERPLRQCSFERIYFSRGNDRDIYRERKALGRNLAPIVHQALNRRLEDAVFSFIPNTSESAYIGLIEGIEAIQRTHHADLAWSLLQCGELTRDRLEFLMDIHPRADKVAHKDQKLRTFITHDAARKDLVSHVYDITRGTVNPDDTLVVVDDSIVRGTTLRDSVITMLSRLGPARIIVASSAPPIMYPDCYGIDMSHLGRFIAFEAAVNLVTARGQASVLDEIEAACRAQAELPAAKMRNHVKRLYDLVTHQELCAEVARLITPRGVSWAGTVEVVYQTVEGLRQAMPGHTGDWYFTGDYPTPGGYRVLNRAYLNWRSGIDGRAY